MKDSMAAEVSREPAASPGNIDQPPARPYLVDATMLDAAGLTEPAIVAGIHANPVKRVFDVIGALSLLLFFAPVLVAIAAALKLRHGGPVLFAHRRIGRDNNEFACLKFRTMVPDADRVLAQCLAFISFCPLLQLD